MIRLRTLAVLVAILAAVAARAGAQTPVDPWDACRDTSAPEPAIAACTTVIEQRQGQTEALALAHADRDPHEIPDHQLRRALVEASRRAIGELRGAGTIGDDAYRRVEEELDRLELSASG